MSGNLIKLYIFYKKIFTVVESSSNIQIDFRKVNKLTVNVRNSINKKDKGSDNSHKVI